MGEAAAGWRSCQLPCLRGAWSELEVGRAEEVEAGKEGKLVVNEERSQFLHIFLDLKHKDLYPPPTHGRGP